MAQFVFLSVARNFPRNFARYRLCYCRNWKWQQISILNTFIGYDLSKWRQKCSILCGCETTRLRLLLPLEVLNILTSFKRPQYLNTFPETFTRFARGGHKIVFHPPTYNMIYQFYNFYNFLSYCNFLGGRDNIWLHLMHWSSAIIAAITLYMYQADGKLTHFSFSSLGTFYCIQLLPLYLLLWFIAYPRKCLWNGS